MKTKKHIVIIDDDPFIRRLFGAKLASAGFEVLYANDGHAGRELVRRFLPDLVILDINMPGANGYDIAMRLHNEERTKDIPVIFLTNEDFSAEAEKAAKEVYVVDYLHKGMDTEEFIKRVKKAVNSKQKSKEKNNEPAKS